MKTQIILNAATILFSEKADGDMRDSQENRDAFIKNSGVRVTGVIAPRLEHGNRVQVIDQSYFSKNYAGSDEKYRPVCDALTTNLTGIMLTVGFADCYSVILVDPYHHAIGIAHCGWRGLHQNILSALAEYMLFEYGSRGSDLTAYLGPGIYPEAYKVRNDVYKLFYPKRAAEYSPAQFELDLKPIIESQLALNGIKSVQYNGEDTFGDLARSGEFKYFSGRRDKLTPPKTNMAAIVIE